MWGNSPPAWAVLEQAGMGHDGKSCNVSHRPVICVRIVGIYGSNDTERRQSMGKFGRKNGDSKKAAEKKMAQQLAALKRRQAKKK